MLSEYFTTQGYAVDAASSGHEALAAVKQARPDLVLLDVRMPGLDGVEVLRRIREVEGDITLLLTIAADLSDLPGSDRDQVEAALEAARRSLSVGR